VFSLACLAADLPVKKKDKNDIRLVKASRAYSFVKYQENNLFLPEPLAMTGFYKALDALRSGTRQKVNVVHIGDSHIQADIFSGRLRTLLQDTGAFGNGG